MNDLDPDTLLAIMIGTLIAVDIAFGIISARVASGKGRSAALGFLTGFILNVLGLIIVMLMRPSVEAEARRRVEVEREYEHQREGQCFLSRSEPANHAKLSAGPDSQSPPWIPAETVEYATSFIAIRRSGFLGGVGEALGFGAARIHVAVLSSREQRTHGLAKLEHIARNDPETHGVLYWWPGEGEHRFAFHNASALEVCIMAVDPRGSIIEILTLPARGDVDFYPTDPIGSAIAVPKSEFKALWVSVGDRFLISRDL